MGYFDQAVDPYDPNALAALRIQQAIAQSAMPTPYRTPLFSGFGAIAGAKADAAEEAMKNRAAQTTQAGANLGLMQQLQQYNLLAPYMGGQPLSIDQLMGLKLGGKQPQGQSGPQQQTGPTSAPYGMPQTPMSGTIPGQGDTQGNSASPGAPQNSVAQAMIMRMLGFQPTDYQRAKLAAQTMSPGPERDEAEAAAMHAAGDRYQIMRNGWAYDRVAQKWIHNPSLGEGITASMDPNTGQETASIVPGYLPSAQAVERTTKGVEAEKEKNVAGFENYLQTGGLGMGLPQGGIAPQSGTPDASYAANVAQAESHGDPNARNPMPGQTAAGLDGFTNGTFLSTAKKHLPAGMIEGMDDGQLLQLRSNPDVSTFLTGKLAEDNHASLSAGGVQNIGSPELYIAHHFGAGDGQKILSSPVNTPIDKIVSAKVMAANPDLQGKTVADVYMQARHSMAGSLPSTPAAPPKPQPIVGETIGNVKTVVPPASEQAPIQRGEEYLKARMPDWAKTEDDWADALPSNMIGEQRGMALLDALKKTQSGQWATDKAQINAQLKAVGMPQIFSDNPAEVEKALKDNFAATLEQIRSFTSRPAAVEVTLGQKNFMNPNLQPEANLAIGSQVIGTLRWERALMNDWATAKKAGWVDPQDYQRAWTKANPIQKFVDATQKEIGPLKGMEKVTPASKLKTQPTQQDLEDTAKKYGWTVDQVKQKLGLP